MSPAKKRSTRVAREAEPRTLTDPKAMRALAHPLRIQILEALTREGPLTATEAADLIGESPANASFHLRTLAKYGFVEEADTGSGRARPWRRVHLGQTFTNEHEDADAVVAAEALSDLSNERFIQRLQAFRRYRHSLAKEWQDNSFSSELLLYLTPDELEELDARLLEVLKPFMDRTLDKVKRPAGSGPVQVATFGFPRLPNPSGN